MSWKRALFVGVAVATSLWGAGCAKTSPPLTPATSAAIPSADVQFQLSNSTAYYTVKGTSTEEIFASIAANGLRDDQGGKAVGLTGHNLSYKVNDLATSEGACSLVSVTINLDIIVTLPQIQTLDLLTPDLRARWNDYAARVAAHEQHHVDIAVTGAKELKTRIETMKPEPLGCDALGKDLVDVWREQTQESDHAQAQFHADEEARLAPILAGLKKVVDDYQMQLAGLESQIAALNSSADSLARQIDALTPQLIALKQHADSIEARYPSLVLPPGTYEDHQATKSRYNALVANQNQLIQQRNVVVAQQNALVTRHNGLLADAEQANEDYNWADA